MTADLLDSTKFLDEDEYNHLNMRLNRRVTRDTTLLLLLMTYGMRSGELLRLKLRDINFSEHSIRIYGSKGSRSREFPLSKEMFKRLKVESDKCADKEDKIFDIKYNRLCDIWHHWRPSDKPLHCLRHTAAIRLYQDTKDIQLVQQILGHRYLGNTLIYQQFTYNQNKMREVFNV